MYEISPRHSIGLRKKIFNNFMEVYHGKRKSLNSILSYSGCKLSNIKVLNAYMERLIPLLHESALHVENLSTENRFALWALMASPQQKMERNSEGELFKQDYLNLEFLRISFNPKAYGFIANNLGTFIEISDHAIERVFQRLKTNDISVFQNELASLTKTAMTIYLAVESYPKKRRPFRIVIPSENGAFLANYDSSKSVCCIKTYIRNDSYGWQKDSIQHTREWASKNFGASNMQIAAQNLFTDNVNKWWFEKTI